MSNKGSTSMLILCKCTGIRGVRGFSRVISEKQTPRTVVLLSPSLYHLPRSLCLSLIRPLRNEIYRYRDGRAPRPVSSEPVELLTDIMINKYITHDIRAVLPTGVENSKSAATIDKHFIRVYNIMYSIRVKTTVSMIYFLIAMKIIKTDKKKK